MATAPPDMAYELLTPSRRVLAGVMLGFANFMVVLDLTIANVSVPSIAGNLGVTTEQATWTITSYAVAEAICVPLTGWLAQRFGAVRLFILGMVGFGLFSLLCGISTTLGMLVAARIGQGICGAPIMPATQTLLMRIFPPEGRSKAMAGWAMTVTLGPALGPVLGGIINDQISWHWIFLVNVPIAAFLVVCAIWLLRPVETPRVKVPIDFIGLVLLVIWVGSLQMMLDTGHNHGWFDDPTIIALCITAAVGFLVFVIWELTDDHPIVDLRVFRHRGFALSALVMGLSFGAFFAGIVLVPQWLQTSLGYDATTAGLISASHAFVAFAMGFPMAKVLPVFGPRVLILYGLFWLALSTGLRTFWVTDADYMAYLLPLMLQGLGITFAFFALMMLGVTSVEPEEVASAAGLQSFVRTLAIALAASVALTTWESTQRAVNAEIVSRLQPEAAERALAGLGMNMEQMRQFIAFLVQKEATTVALNHVFALTTVVFFIAAVLTLFIPNPKRPAAPGGGH